jgi:glycosyltransferase involved in cell wall biosynthesis
MDFPEIAILIITYNRPDEIRAVIAALQENIDYPKDKLKWIVSDDSSGGRYLSDLKRSKSHNEIEFISTPQRGGWGRNVNFGLNHIGVHTNAKYVFQIEDDYLLKHPIDLKAGVALLETHVHIGMLRYRGTSGDRLVLHQFTGDIRSLYPDYTESEGANSGWLCYQLIDGASPTAYIYSNGPHLKRIRHGGFHEFYGNYPEGLKLGDTEIKFCMKVKEQMDIPNAPCIAQLPEFTVMRFDHIGETWKDSEHDI